MTDSVEFMAYFGNLILALLALAMTYTGLPVEPAIILAVLMVFDFLTGLVRAYSVGEPITSHRIKIGVFSKCCVLLVPLVIALAAKGAAGGIDLSWIVNWSISLFILSELYSILGNIYSAKTKQTIPEWDAMSAVLRKVRSVIESLENRENK